MTKSRNTAPKNAGPKTPSPKVSVLTARKAHPASNTMRQSSALLLAAATLLAGLFLGWQGAVMVLNQEVSQGGSMPAAAQQAAKGQNPMTSPLMAKAKTLEDQAAKNPNDPAVWAELGNTYYDAGLAERSVASYQKSLALKPDQPDVWTDMGVMLRAMNKPSEAIKAFEQAASLSPRHEQSRLNIGVVKMFDLNDKEGAIAAWKSLLAVNPEAKMPDGKRVADALKDISK